MKNSNSSSTNCVNISKSATVEQCEANFQAPIVAPSAAADPILNVPVILSQVNVSSNLVANIQLPEPVLEIKDIKKRVAITQCRLMTPTVSPGPGVDPFATGDYQLYIEGHVRKNIQYAAPAPYSSGECVSSTMKSFTTEIPFKCVATIDAADFIRPVQLPLTNTRSEFDFFRTQNLGHGFPEKDQFMSSDLSQFHQVSTQFYNNLPYCELVSHSIIEWDEATDRTPLEQGVPYGEGTFQNMLEKMFLQFTVKILQVQHIRVDAL
ncbi:DUF3794 domain-containing protein [Anaerobacillus sp. CMMVII]|uniref:CsxC family protein n=1 Tax=Anaerobacillus sp. CMMVII TaxID=2755588 RepID=UPI0021B7D006|nr:DUF3794 domain-containing protein [Anaerobacillus sp. CMMVII]MCT8138286.1 DUF3794 domain-containing protein [Anaerobacillus sp. CMMVII]